MYIALSGSIERQANQSTTLPQQVDPDSASIAPSVLGLNSMAALCFSGVFIILKVNNERNQIKWHSGIFMISFISFLTSAIILIALQCLTLLTDANFKMETHDPSEIQQYLVSS